MILWRVSEYADLDGSGGLRVKGRWHRAGNPIVYTAEHSALALLESLIRLEIEQEASTYQLLEINVPDRLGVTAFPGDLPPSEKEASRDWGQEWLAALQTPLARVPSVLAPHAFNVLINPAHRDAAKISITRHARYEWDPRLFARA